MRLKLARAGRLLLFAVLTLGFGASPAFVPASAATAWVKAPSSRVGLQLPDGFAASKLFSGFVDELRGVSIVVVEFPGKEFSDLEKGLTPDSLAAKGITDVKVGQLPRSGRHVFVRAVQNTPSAHVGKRLLLMHESDVTALITVNVDLASLERGLAREQDIEEWLGSARVEATAAPAPALFEFGELGPFKEAGQFLSTSRIYTLDGQAHPQPRSVGKPMIVVAPSLDKRPLFAPGAYADGLIAGLPGLTGIEIQSKREVSVSGLSGVETVAKARDRESPTQVLVLQLLLMAPDGGYYRIVAEAPWIERTRYLEEFRRIALSFKPVQ